VAGGFKTWGDYFYPGTKVLRNRRGITDADRLEQYEHLMTTRRIDEAIVEMSTDAYDYGFMKSVRRWIFQDVYEWAGEPRVGPAFPDLMAKGGPDVSGGPGVDPGETAIGHSHESDQSLTPSTGRVYRWIADRQNLVGLDLDPLLEDLAEAWAGVNSGASH